MLINKLDMQKQVILEEMDAFIAHYFEWDETKQLNSITKILDAYRFHQDMEEKYVYEAIDPAVSGRNLPNPGRN